ncbi:MAG: recombinase zinc beta ribbon domain-containing protein [Patescibacteria group bacterium]|nr:recombinase zinc beta ribbon domain-containing protein [Patescibacteria group bacterium]
MAVYRPWEGKVLEHNEPFASIFKEAMEKFAKYELTTLEDCKNFILAKYQIYGIKQKLSLNGVTKILTCPLNGGFVKCDLWELPLIKGQHKGLTSEQVYYAIQERLTKSAKPRLRKDINLDFVLRGFILCPGCGKPYTASWHSGRGKNYPYYWCKTKGCKNQHLTILREKMEKAFEELLKQIAPGKKTIKLATAILKDLWQKREKNNANYLLAKNNEVKTIERQIENYLDRIGKTANEEAIKIYEDKITKLSDRKKELEGEIKKQNGSAEDFGTALSIVMQYLEDPINIWGNADYKKKRLLLSVYFPDKITYDRASGFGTARFSNIINMITEKSAPKKSMVEIIEKSFNTIQDYFMRWYPHLLELENKQQLLAEAGPTVSQPGILTMNNEQDMTQAAA